MLTTGIELLTDARARGRAVPAMTTYTLESTRAIVAAAEELGLPVILQAGSSSFGRIGRELAAAAALAAARGAGVPVGVHLDHCTDVDEIDACIELGYTSVMYDGSHLPFEENVAITASVVERAHARGVWVEAELGALPGDENASTEVAAGEGTDPAQAAEFAERTGVDALAVAIGNVHGFTPVPVRLDLPRLRAIAAATPVPLVLHGASGLSEEDLRGAVAAGVCKININAELRRAHVDALAEALPTAGDSVAKLQSAAVDAIARVAREKLELLMGGAIT